MNKIRDSAYTYHLQSVRVRIGLTKSVHALFMLPQILLLVDPTTTYPFEFEDKLRNINKGRHLNGNPFHPWYIQADFVSTTFPNTFHKQTEYPVYTTRREGPKQPERWKIQFPSVISSLKGHVYVRAM